MNIIKKTKTGKGAGLVSLVVNLFLLMTIMGCSLYPPPSNAQSDIVSVDPITHKLNRTNFMGSVAIFKGLYIGTNEVLTTGASSINTLATTNYVNSTVAFAANASTNYANTVTQGLVTASITNGLATTSFVNTVVNTVVNTAISNITPASIGAISNTALGIANAGGVTNFTSEVTLGGWTLSRAYAGHGILKSPTGSGWLQDSNGVTVCIWDTTTRYLGCAGSGVSAAFGNDFRVYVPGASNPGFASLPVYTTLTNLLQVTSNVNTTVSSLLATNGNAIALTNFPSNVVQTNQVQYTTTVAKAANAWQNPASAINWSWTSDGMQVTLTGYTGPTDVVFPDILDGLPVTGFGTTIFSEDGTGSSITSVSGGRYITSIGAVAFYACQQLTSVALVNVTTIGGDAFSGCSGLSSISFPSATSIGGSAFANCGGLSSVSMPSVTSLGNLAFFDCTGLVFASLPLVNTVGDYSFWLCTNLKSIIFAQDAPAQATSVYLDAPNVTNYVTNPQATGWGATWNGRPVVRLALYGSGEALTGIATAANMAIGFDATTNRIVAATNEIDGAFLASKGALTNAWQNPGSATNWTWIKTEQAVILTGYTGPNDVMIPDMLDGLPVTGFGTIFMNNVDIISISGKNITNLANNAFDFCVSLASVDLPNVKSIGSSAFYFSASITSVDFPSATSIGASAFSRCLNLATVNIPNVTSVGSSGFDFCPALISVRFGRDAPAEASTVYASSTHVTNYVTSSTATGWTNHWNGRPVVRLLVYADEYWCLGTNLTTLLAGKITKSPITNEFSIPFVTTIPTNSPFLLARLNESQILTQLMSKAQSGSGATATVYVLPTFQSEFADAISTNDILVNSSWNTTNISFTIPIGGGLAIAVPSGYLNITNTIILIRTVIP